jgi:hypothetical protein
MATTFRYGNPAFDCDGAQVHAHCRQLATVVSVSGVIGTHNLARVTEHARRFILGDKPFVLDLGGVVALRGDCTSLLAAVDERSRATRVEWALVAREELVEALGLTDDDAVALAVSLPAALHHLADAVVRTRRGPPRPALV